ncbi:hypothetical protein SAY87_012196 [Trapa incisa]|uniref:Uncharacterized protein n=1 Tax=Trapa incisa TaxID=236973 RepID=A0AAN7JIP7_9MYRT|nr:hypothetical protein SAY87_012196 [Trapa incisa]
MNQSHYNYQDQPPMSYPAPAVVAQQRPYVEPPPAVVLLCAAAVSWMPASRDRLDRHGWILLHSHYHPFVYLLHLQVFDAENVIFHRVHSLFDIILDLYAENVIFASFNLNTDPELACL